MKRCHLPRWLGALALPLLAPWAAATTVIAPDFDKLVGSADYVVRATVTSVTAQWRDNPDRPGQKYIASLVALDVHEVLKGAPPSPLVLDLVGGRIGEDELVIAGTPRFEVGQESILFISGNGRYVTPLVGMHHGYYRVRRDKRTGETQVIRSSGKLLFTEQEVALPEAAASPVPVRDPQAKPLSTGQFASLIRSTAKKLDDARRERLK